MRDYHRFVKRRERQQVAFGKLLDMELRLRARYPKAFETLYDFLKTSKAKGKKPRGKRKRYVVFHPLPMTKAEIASCKRRRIQPGAVSQCKVNLLSPEEIDRIMRTGPHAPEAVKYCED